MSYIKNKIFIKGVGSKDKELTLEEYQDFWSSEESRRSNYLASKEYREREAIKAFINTGNINPLSQSS